MGLLPRRMVIAVIGFCFSLAASAAQQQPPPAPAAGGVAASGPTFRVVRTVSGSKGSVDGGRFVMDDPRTIFYLPQDKQVIVYFEWEGPLGTHKFEGYWKNPEGKVSAISEFSFEAKDKRFGGYWSLALSETMATGVWTLEARVDGEVTGTHAFQVISAQKPPDAPPPPRMLPAAEIYKLAVDTSVFIERLDSEGKRYSAGLGFFIGDNIIATAFEVIDGASSLQITLPGGQKARCDSVLAWNRKQDWAVLEVPAQGAPHLERAEKSSGVGDRLFYLDSSSEGARTIVDVDVIGLQEYPGAGQRMVLSGAGSSGAVGGASINEYGKVTGVLGGALYPGISAMLSRRFSISAGVYELGGGMRGSFSVPIGMVSLATSNRTSLGDLMRSGQFTPLLAQEDETLTGVFCKQVDRKTPYGRPIGEATIFHMGDKELYLYLSLDPKRKRKADSAVELYDLENHPLERTKPNKLQLELGKIVAMDWKLPINSLRPGIYRADVTFDGTPVWRGYFRIVE